MTSDPRDDLDPSGIMKALDEAKTLLCSGWHAAPRLLDNGVGQSDYEKLIDMVELRLSSVIGSLEARSEFKGHVT